MEERRLSSLLEAVVPLVRRAGEAIEAVRRGPLGTESKADGSPVTRVASRGSARRSWTRAQRPSASPLNTS